MNGIAALQSKINNRIRKAKKGDGPVYVGYTMNYAVHVHERTELKHKEDKQAKFLETAYREMKPEVGRIVKSVFLLASSSLKRALYVAGLAIRRRAQKITPVDTGALKASAYTKYDNPK